jgi:hypothetical protein
MIMKKLMTMALVGIITLGSMSLSFAASPFRAADIYAGLANITVEQAYAIKLESGETFGALAKSEGFYEAFAETILASKILMINNLVSEGKLTQTEADVLMTSLENCDGTQQHLMKDLLNLGQQARSGENKGQAMHTGTGGQFNRAENAKAFGQMRRGQSN